MLHVAHLDVQTQEVCVGEVSVMLGLKHLMIREGMGPWSLTEFQRGTLTHRQKILVPLVTMAMSNIDMFSQRCKGRGWRMLQQNT